MSQPAAEAERRRLAQAWADWCSEEPIRRACLLEHLAKGRPIAPTLCRHCERRHL